MKTSRKIAKEVIMHEYRVRHPRVQKLTTSCSGGVLSLDPRRCGYENREIFLVLSYAVKRVITGLCPLHRRRNTHV